MIRVSEVKVPLTQKGNLEAIKSRVAQKLKIKTEEIKEIRMVRESIDARRDIQFSYVVDVETNLEKALVKKGFSLAPESYVPDFIKMKSPLHSKERPIVVGFGPAGMFAALSLAYAGLKPIVFERGGSVEERDLAVSKFWEEGLLNPESNVQFGEGGAGTYSDGKLTSRIKDSRIEWVLAELVKFGAKEEIMYAQKPHIGTDQLRKIVKNMREKIISLGGTLYFNHRVDQLLIDEEKHKIKGVSVCGKDYKSSAVILATGHSARDTFQMLYEKKIHLEAKPFAVGVRIEHPQKIIDASQYGKHFEHPSLETASYQLTHRASNGRSAYTFCMCPGGLVVASASEPEHLVVNGMSYSQRDLPNANSAILVNVTPDDYEEKNPLGGIGYQRKIERSAYEVGLKNQKKYHAPCESLKTFLSLAENTSEAKKYYERVGLDYEQAWSDFKPSYQPGLVPLSLKSILPVEVTSAIEEALPQWGKKIKGFDDPRAVITGVETRSSSPVRIVRNPDTLMSISHEGLFPSGEGAGYAGGISSSAVDGVKIAERVLLFINNSVTI